MPLSEKAKKNKLDYIHTYNKTHYKRVPLDLTPDLYTRTKSAADSLGESVNGFIKTSITERIERTQGDLSANDPQNSEDN